MLLWIIRHGKARADSPSGTDYDRALKPRGERQAAYLGAEFASRDDAPARLLASPLVRAQQTALGIAEVTGQEVETHGALESGRGPAGILALAEEIAGGTSAALIGHNPELSQVVAALAGPGTVESDWLRTGQAVGIDWDPAAAAGFVVDVLRMDDE